MTEESNIFQYKEKEFIPDLKVDRLEYNLLDNTKIRVYLSGGDQSIPDTTATKVTFNAKTYDFLSEFDLVTNNRFTVVRPGNYFIYSNILWISPTDQKTYQTIIYVNGSAVTSGVVNSSGTNYVGSSVMDFITLNKGDYIEIYAQHNSGSSKNISSNSIYTYLTIKKL